MDHKFKSKWENNAFIFDTDHGYDGISWRQRNFMCNFCKKEYKSAQALGGHMNVHRRDRARLRLSSPSLDHQPNPNPNPNLFSSPPSLQPYKTFHSSLLSLSSPSLTLENEEKQDMFPTVPRSAPNFGGDLRKNLNINGFIANVNDQENESNVWKKRESNSRVEMGMGLGLGLDLELRLGRS